MKYNFLTLVFESKETCLKSERKNTKTYIICEIMKATY